MSSGSSAPTNAAGVALLVLNVAGVPGLIKSTETGHPHGRLFGYGLAVAVGAASSALSRSPWPFLGTVAMCLLMLHLQSDQAGVSGRTPTPVDRDAPTGAGRFNHG